MKLIISLLRTIPMKLINFSSLAIAVRTVRKYTVQPVS
jgi:hypothetical protein